MNNLKILLSIIIPVYNAEKYISDCLNSLLNQDISTEEYEIICVNDGSTDNSRIILQEYLEKNPNVVVIDKTNGGVSSARNQGLHVSRGEYVWFVDSDDWVTGNCFGIIKQQIIKHHPDAIQVQYDWIKADWRIKQCINALFKTDNALCSNPSNIALKYDGAWSTILQKNVLTRFDLKFIGHLHYGEDILFIRDFFDGLRIEEENGSVPQIIHIQNEIIYYYRIHDESAMNSAWTRHRQKYSDALLDLAVINKARMNEVDKPAWYRNEYKKLYIQRMYNYMMHWLPGLNISLKEALIRLKEKGIYPIKKRLLTKYVFDSSASSRLSTKAKEIYKYFTFK